MEYSEGFLGSLFENMLNSFAYHKIVTNEDGKPIDYIYLDVNHAFEKIVGLKKEELVGKSVKTVSPKIVEDTFNWIDFYGEVALENTSPTTEQYSESLGKWLLINAFSPEKGYFVSIIMDITEIKNRDIYISQKNAELNLLYSEILHSDEEIKRQMVTLKSIQQTLLENEKRVDVAQKIAHIGHWDYDLKEDVYWGSEGAFNLFGLKRETPIVKGEKFKELILPENREQLKRHFKAFLNNNERFDEEFKIIRNDDEALRYLHAIAELTFDSEGKPIKVIGAIQDITSLKLNEDKIKHMAYHDPLTNLPNRLLFFDRLTNAINRSKRTRTKIAVLFFDMDNFKRINDTLGHSIGDELLVETGKRIISCMREYDTVARLSGDEFAVLLQNIERNEDMLSIVTRIQQKFSLPFFLTDSTIELSTSIGIAMYPEDGNTPEELLKNADTAMYKAKEQGRNKYLFFHFTMKEDVIKKVKIEKLLKRAVKYREFVLYYQPQFVAKDLSLRGFEALIRWSSPELGFVSPKDFISIAEENGQILDIGEWVIQEACYMLKRMKEKYAIDLKMSINLSLLQLRQKDFDQLVLSYVHYYKLDPQSIELEVTEGHFIDHYDVALNVLNKLKKHGFGIALDDFGTGYSSLSYLKKLPINMLKIDQAFVKEIDASKPENDLTEPIISLVHKLGIETTAEGVETEEQMNYLIHSNCDYLQGYHLGRPVPKKEAEEIIKKSLQKPPAYES